jgi:hypothetical protein
MGNMVMVNELKYFGKNTEKWYRPTIANRGCFAFLF